MSDIPNQVPEMISKYKVALTSEMLISPLLGSVLLSILSPGVLKSGKLPSVQDLLATPMFSLTSESLPGPPPRLKLSSGSKEALRLAVEAGGRRLVEAAAELKTFRKLSKVRKEPEVDTNTKRKVARSVSALHLKLVENHVFQFNFS